MWRKGVRILLETIVVDTVKALLSGAYIDWQLVEATATPTASVPEASNLPESGVNSDERTSL